MKKGILFILLMSMALGQEYTKLTLDDVFSSFFKYRPFSARWLPGQDRFAFEKTDSINGTSIYSTDPIKGDTVMMVRGNDIRYGDSTLEFSQWHFSNNLNRLLLQSGTRRIWRRSRTAQYFVYTPDDQSVIQLADGKYLRNVKFSPNGDRVAYVKNDNNLYVYDLVKHKEYRMTRDGSETISNGEFGWVYEEEFGTYDAYRWSPDSKYIAFWREDETQVPKYPLVDYMSLYPKTQYVRYPKVGETNPSMKIGVKKVGSWFTKWMKLPDDSNIYYPRLYWVPGQNGNDSDHLLIMKLNRLQNDLELVSANIHSGEAHTIYEDTDPAWVDVTDDLHYLSDGSFIWTSEKSGYRHIYLISGDGKSETQLTSGDWEVKRIVDVDARGGWIYFYSTRSSTTGQGLDRVHMATKSIESITPEAGWHSTTMAPGHDLFIDSWSSASRPSTKRLKRIDGQIVKTFIEPDTSDLRKFGFTFPRFFQIATSDDSTLLNAMITLPRDFDPSKKYPVLFYGYGCPTNQVVQDYWGGFQVYWNQYMSQHGIILFSVDNRGTGGRGKAFKDKAYGDISKYMVNDHIDAVKYLRSLPYVDPDRIGIWGWSGGGYLTSMCLTKGADYFTMGCAVAPVIDFRLYDTIWTERYMGLLSTNSAGYDSASVLTYVDRLKGKLLLSHGTGDDNVHFQNSLQMVNTCISKNKQIDIQIYPNRNHGIYGDNATRYLYTKLTDYILQNL